MTSITSSIGLFQPVNRLNNLNIGPSQSKIPIRPYVTNKSKCPKECIGMCAYYINSYPGLATGNIIGISGTTNGAVVLDNGKKCCYCL